MEILEKFFFDNGLVRVCMVVVDDGHALKAYLGPLSRWADINDDDAAAQVANVGAACPLQMALTLAGPATWMAAAKYEPAIAMMLGFPMPQYPTAPAPAPGPAAAIFHQGRRSGPWPGAPVGGPRPDPAPTPTNRPACGCAAEEISRCYFVQALGRPGCPHDV